jgi:hypothetical protein
MKPQKNSKPMKLFTTSLTILLILSILGCKKDANIIPLESVTSLPFYVDAEYYDNQNPEKRSFNEAIVFNDDDDDDDDFNNIDGVWVSLSAEGATKDGNKYIVAIFTKSPYPWLGSAPFIYNHENEYDNDNDPLEHLPPSTIGFKIVSDRPLEEAERKFTKEELESFLKIGKYDFGEAPFQVEVNFQSLNPESINMWGLSPVLDHELNDFEILDIEDFENEYVEGFKVGKILHVKSTAVASRFSVRFYIEMEGKFFVEYE